jgi:GT2 family glycosyltransferase
MLQLSVIIVNYNVRYFIEQAIVSINKAGQNISMEIIVIDNASSDNSVAILQKKFPQIHIIANKENVGFGKANNQGISIAKGKYILLVNPDTVLQENTLSVCLEFIEKHPDCGALGVKMIDGKGNFLPESKRGLPSPSVAFYKMSGLSSLFPKSQIFNRYHLGFLDKDKNHEVDVLSGAFMFFKGDLLKEIGGFDEDYFMYGEDIDLSYQVLKKGYKNYYVADTSIIHYKGESTKKGSLNYVKVFYEAMLIFAKKHFSKKQTFFYTFAIYSSIIFKGGLTLFLNVLSKIFLPLSDLVFTFFGMVLLSKFWAIEIKNVSSYYPDKFYYLILPLYSFIWLLSSFLMGTYEKPYKIAKIVKGVLVGTLVIAALYGFLPESLRFSRALILLGGILVAVVMLLTRFCFHILKHKKATFELNEQTRICIVGEKEEAQRALNLLSESQVNIDYIGFISTQEEVNSTSYLGVFSNLSDLLSIHQIEELIFCSKDIPSFEIISCMSELGNQYNYKILPESSVSIIGSNSKNDAGDLYALDVNLKIASQRSKLLKRSFDIVLALFMLLSAPLLVWFYQNKKQFLQNIIAVFWGEKTWVSYQENSSISKELKLPKIKNGILNPSYLFKNKKGLNAHHSNLLYAKNYSLEMDVKILVLGFKNLDVKNY